MRMIKICSYNIKNNFLRHIDKTDKIIDFINKYDLDILGVQEYIFRDSRKFNLEGYKCIGMGRYKKKNNVFNETCAIITKYNITSHKVHKLPWFLTTFRRIINEATLIDKDNNKYVIMNTHIDFLHNYSKKIQLKYILKHIRRIYNNNSNIILMGDFNLNTNNKILNNFINELNTLNISRVNISDRTYKTLDKPIDHIFISNNLKVNKVKIIKEKKYDISDHYPIYVELE